MSAHGVPSLPSRTDIHSGYQGTLGFGFATALGAKVGRPDRPVVSVSGDGGFMYNDQELSTAVKHGIDIVAIVFATAPTVMCAACRRRTTATG